MGNCTNPKLYIHPNYNKNSNKFSQTKALFCQLPQNMTTDCSLNCMLSTCYFTTNCSERRQKFKTILCKVWGIIKVNLSYNRYVTFWVNWRVQVHLKEFNLYLSVMELIGPSGQNCWRFLQNWVGKSGKWVSSLKRWLT